MPLTVAIDAGPLHGPRTGIGNAVAWTIDALRDDADLELRPYVTSMRARIRSTQRRMPIPAAVALRLWARRSPPVDRLLGHPAVVHGTNYVVPPARCRAAGLRLRLLVPRTSRRCAARRSTGSRRAAPCRRRRCERGHEFRCDEPPCPRTPRHRPRPHHPPRATTDRADGDDVVGAERTPGSHRARRSFSPSAPSSDARTCPRSFLLSGVSLASTRTSSW